MTKNILRKLENIQNCIGNTPLIEIRYIYKGVEGKIYAKLEWYNLSGSIKDRVAFGIIKEAYEKGLLKEGQTICETTSGNMGIALSAIANVTGNPIVICMPKTMSEERKKLLKLYGATLVETESFKDAFEKAEEYRLEGAFLPYQFENKINSLTHYNSTAQEIYQKIKNIPAFVSGVGTGGTLMGTGKFLKGKCNSKVIAIDPKESSILTLGKSQGEHKIQGLSDGLIPKLYNQNMVDKIISIKSDDAIAMAVKLSQELGLSVGISSGANFLGGVLSGEREVVTVFADDGKKYLSSLLPIKRRLTDSIKLLDYKVIE